MTYQETLDWLFNQFPMYQKLGKQAYKANLSNTIDLVQYLNHPEQKFKSIHVGGTNGKGSTSHMLSSILQEAGYNVGLYTSPHLKDFRERIKVNGVCISEDYVIEFVEQHQSFFNEKQLSFFEMTVGMAFQYFAEMQVDIAIIEVGLGGRLDSTNIITPEVSVITNIGLDHVQFLGDTHEKIASEKAGIIKKDIPCVIGTSLPETKVVFETKAEEVSSPLYFAEDNQSIPLETDLKGYYQEENKKTAYTALSLLKQQGWRISDNAMKNGFANVVANTGLLGRWQILEKKPFTVCDTAHNKEGLSIVLQQIQDHTKSKLHIVLGIVSDKDLERILPLFPKDAQYYFTKPKINRALCEKKLQKLATNFDLKGDTYSSVQEAYSTAKQEATIDDMIYIGGSTFVVSEII